MNRVERIKEQVKTLTAEELRAFRVWFAAFDAEAWDVQIEEDAKSGKLKSLAERAIRDHDAGRSTPLALRTDDYFRERADRGNVKKPSNF